MGESKFPEVLILSIPGDIHTHAVIWALRHRGVNAEVVIPGDLPDFTKISINIDGSGTDVVFRDREGTEVHTSNVKLVWNRRVGYPPVPDRTHEHDREVVQEAYRNHVDNLRAVLTRQATFINSPEVQYLAGKKALQLTTAIEVGFVVPGTCISNDFDSAVTTKQKYRDIISKLYYSRLWRKDGETFGAYTTIVESIEPDDRASIELCPSFFQEAIVALDSEVRLIAFGDYVYGMRMRRSESDNGVPTDGICDSRLLLEYGKYDCSVADIPEEVRCKVRHYMDLLGLKFGAFDFLINSDGQWVFLECNEGGQFLFLEEQLGSIKLLKGFTDWLASHVGIPEAQDSDEISLASYYAASVFADRDAEFGKHNDFSAYRRTVEEDEHMSDTQFSGYQ